MELGCSYGKATKILCEQAGVDRVVGVDLGLEALEACQKVVVHTHTHTIHQIHTQAHAHAHTHTHTHTHTHIEPTLTHTHAQT